MLQMTRLADDVRLNQAANEERMHIRFMFREILANPAKPAMFWRIDIERWHCRGTRMHAPVVRRIG